MTRKLTTLIALSLVALTLTSNADQKQYKNIVISESINALVNTTNKEIYIPITIPLQNTFEACGAQYKFKAEGFNFLHYEDMNVKDKVFDASKCSEVITENTFNKVEPELLKEKTPYAETINKLNTELADISNALKGARKYKIIKKGEYGRAYIDSSNTIRGVYIKDNVYGKKVFAMPSNDLEKMNKYKESVVKYKEWNIKLDEQMKRQQELDKIEEQKEKENVKNEETKNSTNSTDNK